MKRRTIGRDNSQTRRRARRAAARREQRGTLSQTDLREIESLVADGLETLAATGSTDLPLSDRNASWDAAAAKKGLSDDQVSKAFFWSDGKTQKLPFAANMSGTLTAIWKGVTSAAGAVQGARGGVSIPSGDVAGVKSKIASYYAAAAKKYGDDSIKVPWAADFDAGETPEGLLAYAEIGSALDAGYGSNEEAWREAVEERAVYIRATWSLMEQGILTGDDEAYRMFAEGEFSADQLAELAETGTLSVVVVGEPGAPEFQNGWGSPGADPVGDIIETIEREVFGGKPNQGTKKDKRLKENDPAPAAQRNPKPGGDDGDVQDTGALDAIDAYQAALRCACGHPFSEHAGAQGACGHEDGRGTCSCGEFAAPEADVASLTNVILESRPDLVQHEAKVMRHVERLLWLSAAAGDVAWGPEDGFVDLLCDVNETLANGTPSYMGPRAVDAGVKLDKVLICDGDDYYVAPITIDGTGEPVLSDKTDWVHVEEGWIESADDDEADDKKSMTAAAIRQAFAPAAEVPAPVEVLPEASDEITPPAPAPASGEIPWHATFIPEGKLTEDGRSFAPGATIMPGEEGARELPLTLMGLIETSAEGGHDRAKVAGRIDALYRNAPNVEADGAFSNEEWGQMIARMVESKELKGLSVDIAPLEYSWVPRDQFFNESGDWIGVWDQDAGEWAPAPGTESLSEGEDEDPLAKFFGEDDRVLVITKAVIGMATVCPFPAFGGAEIGLTAAGMPSQVIVPLQMEMPAEALVAAGIPLCEECRGEVEVEVVESEATATGLAQPSLPHSAPSASDEPVLTAAAAGHAPVRPPASWFERPEFESLTPLTITDDGRVYGHAWAWESCHLSFDQCVTAPHSAAEYGYFLFGELECEQGERLNVGRITYDTGHAGVRLSRAEAIRHYDDTGTQAAFVSFYEDEFGGAFAGCVAADFPETDLQHLRASAISGDWRGIDGNLELVALLAVNLGGFPVPRGAITAAGDESEPLSLVAAGVVTDSRIAEIQRLAGEAIETGGTIVPEILTDQIIREIENLTDTPERVLGKVARPRD